MGMLVQLHRCMAENKRIAVTIKVRMPVWQEAYGAYRRS